MIGKMNLKLQQQNMNVNLLNKENTKMNDGAPTSRNYYQSAIETIVFAGSITDNNEHGPDSIHT